MIKLLIVDDSPTELALLDYIFSSSPDIQIVGTAKNGKEAIELAEKLKPDLITMDILMPEMDGYGAIRHIMRHNPTPIVVISSKFNKNSVAGSYEALDIGALSVLEKPRDITSPQFDIEKKNLIDTVRSMAEIKVIRRRFFSEPKIRTVSTPTEVSSKNKKFEIVAIGTSVGGPHALKIILQKLPVDFRVPIVIVQHMIPGYIEGFSHWLNENTSLKIKNAEDHEILMGGTVYFAPDKTHLTVKSIQGKLVARLVNGDTVSGFCPSATVLFESIAKTCGDKAIGVLLTGMGSDGADGLLELKKSHSHTIIQDEKSAVVFGMAGVAQSIGAVDTVVELEQMASYLIDIIQ